MKGYEEEFEDNMRKLLGLPPYDSPSNYCWNDNYFGKFLRDKYGESEVRRMTKKLQKEKKKK